MTKIKVAIIGFGGIARQHNTAFYELVESGFPIEVVAICDKDVSRFATVTTSNLETITTPIPSTAALYTDIDEMLANTPFDLADICLPSFLHKEIACKMMRAGKHVLCEKPMANSSAECEEMLRVSYETKKKLMIGQCLRFESSYLFLKQCIDSNQYGSLNNLFMDRLSVYPNWGANKWYESVEKCGGCILDTHIHDIDMARFLLGEPDFASAVAFDNVSRWQVVNTRLFYKDVTVIVNASWDSSYTTPFHMGFRARFENASVVLEGDELTVYPNDAKPFIPDIPKTNRIAEEIRYMVNMILDDSFENKDNTAESAYQSIKLVETLRRSVALGGERITPI